jgi:hypothetical protein
MNGRDLANKVKPQGKMQKRRQGFRRQKGRIL